MGELRIAVLGARPEPYAASPTLSFQLGIEETSGDPVHSIALRCQIQIEPRQRQYSPREEEGLLDLFGPRARWADTLRTVVWAQTSILVPGFRGSTTVDLPLNCTYDFEVAAAKYFHSLEAGEVPLLLLFSGTLFAKRGESLSVEPVAWDREAAYRLPVALWRATMDRHFPGSAWIRLRRDSFDALHRFRAQEGLPTWEDAIAALLAEAARARKRA
jgi:hypothetical protein